MSVPVRRTVIMAMSLVACLSAGEARPSDGDGSVRVSGELKVWHTITFTCNGPYAHERDTSPNPFTDRRFTVTCTHESGSPSYVIPGYFAADGDAGNTGAEAGTAWRAHLVPDKAGTWRWSVSFVTGPEVALGDAAGTPVAGCDGRSGTVVVTASDKTAPDLRARGRLSYVGRHHLRFAGSGEWFLKAGPDAPETLLAYADFDGTEPGRKRDARTGEAAPSQALHRYQPHVADWRPGDPCWRGERGKGLIGAVNYLASKGLNSISFIPYNAGGDGDNVWPFTARDAKRHYDCSKLDQWGVVFAHAERLGFHLHFKLQENENDDDRVGHKAAPGKVPEALDGGACGPERKLYLRELVARFGHRLALNWNLGEETTQSSDELRAMAAWIRRIDPWRSPIVLHTFPEQQDKVYVPLLGADSPLTGVSLQNDWNVVHQCTLRWIEASAEAGRPWVVANDEQGSADTGVPPDPGYAGYDGTVAGKDGTRKKVQTVDDIRIRTLWGNLMAGGAGVEYYFGYRLPENDLVCEDFRSRDRSWDYCRIALGFFRDHAIPFQDMRNADALVGNPKRANGRWCLAKPGEVYVVLLPQGGACDLDLTGATGTFTVRWFDPRSGGAMQDGPVTTVTGGGMVNLGQPPHDGDKDWLVVVRR